MSNRLFSLIAFGLMAIAFHLAYVLFIPSVNMNEIIQDFSAKNGVNKFSVLDEAGANEILKHDPADIVAAVCVFDLSSGPVKVSSGVTGAYWSISIYSKRGDIIYTLNDRQAAAETISVTISNVTSENPDAPSEAGPPSGNDQAQVVSDSVQGFVVIRSGADLPYQGGAIRKQLERASCKT